MMRVWVLALSDLTETGDHLLLGFHSRVRFKSPIVFIFFLSVLYSVSKSLRNATLEHNCIRNCWMHRAAPDAIVSGVVF